MSDEAHTTDLVTVDELAEWRRDAEYDANLCDWPVDHPARVLRLIDALDDIKARTWRQGFNRASTLLTTFVAHHGDDDLNPYLRDGGGSDE